jgi:hypothetical protein
MANPDQVGDGSGEYLELFNHSGSPIDMTGWTIADRGVNTATFSGVIDPGALFVVGSSGDLNGAAPGGAPDAVWTDDVGNLTLTNTGDTISLLDANGDLVASVAYADGDPFGVGVSLELAVGNAHPNGQTSGDDYVASVTPFGADWGSPGTRGATQYPLPDPALGVEQQGDDLHLDFPTVPAVSYQLWRSLNLDDWFEVGAMDPVIGDGEEGGFTFPLPVEDAEFYRLELRYPAAE